MARTESQRLSERVIALPGGVNCAIVVGDDDQAILVDTGQSKDDGRSIRRACASLGVTPVAIINTHAHADHYGGNAYLVRQFPDVTVYAPPLEADIMRSPYLEPIYLFHGARPLAELTTRWLQAEASPVHVEIEPGTLHVAGVDLTLLDTSGHAHRQIAVQVDDVLLAADAFFGGPVLERYPLPFGQDIAGQLASFEVVGSTGARVALPGHGEATEDIAGAVDANISAVERAADAVVEACQGGGTEDVLATTCGILGIAIGDLPRYHLNLCTVAAYLSMLRDRGVVAVGVDAGALQWTRA